MTRKKKLTIEKSLEWIDDVLGADIEYDAREQLGMIDMWSPPGLPDRNPWPKWDEKFVTGLGKLCRDWIERTTPERKATQERIREHMRQEAEQEHDQHSLVSKYGYGIKKE
tara:strand:+ start:20329 stop:20661 length:333 start_codon:yes stop_codon:yes gene_type:complete